MEEAKRAPSYYDQLSPLYPTPPPAPPKDQYIAPSHTELEAKTSDSACLPRRLPAKVLRNGQLMYHKAYHGPRPTRITYVDTRLYQGGPQADDYIKAFNDEEVIWLRVTVIRDLLDAHHITRQNV